MQRSGGEEETEKKLGEMDFVCQTPSQPPHRTDYIFRHGKRYVTPYYFEFNSHVKNRWTGKTIVDLFTDEFRGRSYDYYVAAVKCGRIKVDDQIVSVYHRLKSSQKITHFVHRHEPPVMAGDVRVLLKHEDVVTVYKPASVPVHPCGQYRKNTVVGILEAEHGLTPLFPIHRLDRLVSGLLIFARNASKAESFRQQITAGLIQKQYIAKVAGVFPEGELIVDANLSHDPREQKSKVEVKDGCADTPLMGKASCTKFRRIDTNGSYSIVLCEPLTGRTHQIRVHLQHAGYPIANDTLYLTDKATTRFSEGVFADRVAVGNSQTSPTHNNVNGREEPHVEDFKIDPMCTNCPNLAPKGYDENEEALWLHCVRYTGPEWTYECPYPEWVHLD